MSTESTQGVILIVDDTPSNLEVLFDFLAGSGFRVLVAEDGESAIERLRYASPDLILLDVLMPNMDGFETCRRLKADASTCDIPVIFMTALSETVDKVMGLSLGAVDYITKPLQHEEVLARIKTHLNLRKLTKQLQAQNLALAQQIQERQRAEQKIREQAALLDITKDAIFVRSLDNQILFWNKGAEHLYGWTAAEAVGNDAEMLFDANSLSTLQKSQAIVLAQGEWQGQIQQSTKAGKEIIVASRCTLVHDEQGQPKSILTVNTDITEKQQLEAQFLRTQRMESIGTLASGIAHDLNNALAPLLMSVHLLRSKLNQSDHQLLDTLERNTQRSAELVKQVLLFARGTEGDRTSIQIETLIQEIEYLTKETFPKNIEIRIDTPSQSLWEISGNQTQLHQVLMNLCINARDAMPQGGILTLAVENFWIDETHARMNIDAKTGPYILITISDTGCGMTAEILDRVFEPFFTTKMIGQGTGLGLSTVLGIVKGHGGFITATSQVGKGTQFKVYFPAIASSPTQSGQVNSAQPIKGQEELILVVDDEEPIRTVTEALLENYGYRVLTASDGIEAIALYIQHKSEINTVILDMMMPSMDGITTIQMLQKINPQIKIIGVSGLMSSYKSTELTGPTIKTFLPKPYSSEDLLRALSVE